MFSFRLPLLKRKIDPESVVRPAPEFTLVQIGPITYENAKPQLNVSYLFADLQSFYR